MIDLTFLRLNLNLVLIPLLYGKFLLQTKFNNSKRFLSFNKKSNEENTRVKILRKSNEPNLSPTATDDIKVFKHKLKNLYIKA